MVRDLIKINRKFICTGSSDKAIKVWDVNSGSCINTLFGHLSHVMSLVKLSKFLFASGSDDKQIFIWNLNNYGDSNEFTGLGNQIIKILVSQDSHTKSVYSLIKFSRYEIISGSYDKTIKIWDLVKGKCLQTLTGHTRYVMSLLKITNNILASGSDDQSIKIWNICTSKSN